MLSKTAFIILIVFACVALAQGQAAPPADTASQAGPDRNLATVRYGLTWGYSGYVELEQELFHVSCGGSPYIPPYAPYHSNAGQCNPYSGDTPCNHTLPILCIDPQDFSRPCYPMVCSPHAMTKEFYCGWTEGILLLSDPVPGITLTSRAAANSICSNKFGPGFRMAAHGDGKYIVGMDDNDFCESTWPVGPKPTGGWGYYGYGVKGPLWTRFWVAIDDQPGNCWVK